MRKTENPVQVKRNVLFVNALMVEEAHRSRGIRSCILEQLKKIAKERGYDALELQVNAKNKRAKELYERLGFSEKSVNMEFIL